MGRAYWPRQFEQTAEDSCNNVFKCFRLQRPLQGKRMEHVKTLDGSLNADEYMLLKIMSLMRNNDDMYKHIQAAPFSFFFFFFYRNYD